MPLNKGKSDGYEYSNSRDISLLSVVGKINGIVLIERIINMTDNAILEVQGGLRRRRGCVDQIFAARQACDEY